MEYYKITVTMFYIFSKLLKYNRVFPFMANTSESVNKKDTMNFYQKVYSVLM